MPSRVTTIPVIAGGRLISSVSLADISPADYQVKRNLRRIQNSEARREGYIKFEPLPAIANQYVFDSADTCIRTTELVRGDGTKEIIGFARTTIKVFNASTGAWDTIGSGYSSSGKRWQIVKIGNTLVANNAVDLPFYYHVNDGAVTPLKELREVGVACVGRILENSGFLIVADITDFKPYWLQIWMTGYAGFSQGGPVAKAVSYHVLVADYGIRFDFTVGAAHKVADMPPAGDMIAVTGLWYVWIKKVDISSGPVLEVVDTPTGEVIATLVQQNDLAFVFWNPSIGRFEAVFFPLGVLTPYDPYGTPPAYMVQRLAWDVANSEYNDPTRWAPAFDVLMNLASASITLPFPSSVFLPGITRVAVINGGPLGGTLGGQENTPNGVLVTGASGATITLEESTDVDLVYPRTVTVMRWTDVSSLVGRYSLQGDSSEIKTLATLRNWIVVFRDTGIYRGRYTGDPNAPFAWEQVYDGSNVPFWPDCVANVKGDYLLYPALGGRMYRYDGVTWPQVHEVCDMAASLFFTGYDQEDEIWALECPQTKEWWFFYPDKTMAYDYAQETLSEIDQKFDAAAYVHKPGATDFWFILAIGRFIYTYGLVYGVTPIVTYKRDGVTVQGVLKWGLLSFNDQSNEKLLKSVTPLFASQSPNAAVELQLYGTWNPNQSPDTLLVPPESLPNPKGYNYVVCSFQYIYFTDQLTIVDTNDVDCRVNGRIFEAEVVNAQGVTRHKN